jgi:gamma-glutamyltranspeptidase/glutathione hydrolase
LLRGVVAAAHPLAAEAGAEMLRRGGNALDAAAAVQWALNVVEPSMSGLGGGTFMMIRFAHNGTVLVLDGREQAPLASTPDEWQKAPSEPAHAWQGLAVGVPGTLKLFDQAVRDYGRLDLADTFGPAVRLAGDGFAVNQDLVLYLNDGDSRAKLASWAPSAKIFQPGSICQGEYGPCRGGRSLLPGERLVQSDLAATMRTIQKDGVRAFYQGPIGQDLVTAQQVRGGRMTMEDLNDYTVAVRQPLHGHYGGHDVFTMPPPGSGLTVLQILGLVEPFHLASTGLNSGASLHLMIEAANLAYADRMKFLGDPAFVDVPVAGLMDPAYLDERRALIHKDAAMTGAPPGDPWRHQNATRPHERPASDLEPGLYTTHFTVVDTEGNVVAVTTTIESLFGSGMVVPGRGFLMSNQMTDFSQVPGTANEVRPGKRPLSAMSPTIVLKDGSPILTVGSPGGPTIIWSVAQVLLNVLEHGQGLAEAVAAPRIVSTSPPSGYLWEPTVPPMSHVELQRLGHKQASQGTFGNVNSAQRTSPDADWVGVFDPRRHGGVSYVSPSEIHPG